MKEIIFLSQKFYFNYVRRIFRKIKWSILGQWSDVTLKQWPYESCITCGNGFRTIWSVEDKYWHKVMGVSDSGGGSLCIDCFIRKAEKLKQKIPQEAFCIDIFYPENEV